MSKKTKTPALLTRADIEEIAAQADARIGRVVSHLCSALLISAGALAAVVLLALYFGLVVIASIMTAVCAVTVTLYLFVRLWPSSSAVARPGASLAPAEEPAPSEVLAPGASRHRVLWTLRQLARRQEQFHISGRAAERVARIVRFVMKSDGRPLSTPRRNGPPAKETLVSRNRVGKGTSA